MALPQLDFTTLNTQADCAKTAAKDAVGRGLTSLKTKLAGLTSGPDGIFSGGAGLANTIKNDVNGLVNNAKKALGDLQQNVVSLRTKLATAVLQWQLEGEEAAQREFDDIKKKFPNFDQNKFVSDLQKPGFSFCSDVKEQTIADGSTTPKNIPDAVPPPMTDASMTIPELPKIPTVSVRPPVGGRLNTLDNRELAKVNAEASLFAK